ncbi:HlyD family secretion protein [Halomonas fontilapidosi]|uniref:Multidrug resistance-like ATP-binding protein MdlB n=1 Tax=Halomonas fontilapidosi TaxID=616675 RepID=A0A7W5DHE2_9GAMM|nr:ABC transporter ATP-binding protein [Halomonas fontilapidosi]MBB3182484.1 HlyD family secretion protein [Halomonas fontilapidosi]
MLPNLKDLYCLLTSGQRKRLIGLQLLVVLMAFAEVAGVVAIGPFMAIVGDMSQLEGEGVIARFYALSGFQDPSDFVFWFGVSVLFILIMASCLSMFTVWKLSMYGQQIGAELSTRLYRHFMQQPWLFHAGGSSAQLTNKISQECARITDKIIAPIMKMNAKVVMVLFMSLAILIYNPLVAATGVIVFVLVYLTLYRTVRRKLVSNGKAISQTQRERFKLMAEGFGGIKDVLLLGRQSVFNSRFEKSSRSLGRARGTTKALSEVPRYAMEMVAFGSVIFLVLYLLSAHRGNLGDILPVLSVFALAGLKLLPAFQQIYTSVATIRGNLAAFDSIREDLFNSRHSQDDDGLKETPRVHVDLHGEIELRDIVFHYPGKSEAALDKLSLIVPVNKVIGLVGASGSGKSTAIDIILGLIEPDSGDLLIDGEALTESLLHPWQNSLGFVSQSIFLADASIRENIAFGLPDEEIDDQRVLRAARMARLDELLCELPEGVETRVGERGIQLSGGQRQRIGIARALYDDANILILDEATSALDGITEKQVMDAIHDFSGNKTIIMIAHRLATVRKCDCIYLIDKGRVIDFGVYDDLVDRNTIFQRMATHA